MNEGKSWTEAILDTLPTRKGAKPRNEIDKDVNKNDEDAIKPEADKNDNKIKLNENDF